VTDQPTPPTADTDTDAGTAPSVRPDRATRQAATWATMVALPLTVIVALTALSRLAPDDPAGPAGSATAPRTSASAAALPTTPVQMSAPQLGERAGIVCRALLSQLPGTLRDLRQRPVTAGAEQNAAYGEPPITVACGVPAPTFPPTDLVYPLDGVCWHAAERPDATVWTTVDREVAVRVSVPRHYEEPGQRVIGLADPLIETVPATETAPTGCRA